MKQHINDLIDAIEAIGIPHMQVIDVYTQVLPVYLAFETQYGEARAMELARKHIVKSAEHYRTVAKYKAQTRAEGTK